MEAYKDYLKSLETSEEGEDSTKEPLPLGKEPLDPARESLEHIIPNAIGGKLKSKNILSHAGNQKLNDEIDKEFVKIFASFTSRLSVNKDRKTTPSMSAFHISHGVKVNFKDGKYFPTSPYYDDKSKTIYAYPLKNAENFKKRLIKDGVISDQDEIELADDMAGQIEIPFDLGNLNFKQGMAKIAIGYASLNGIAREQLDEALDVENNSISQRISLIPSFPTSKSEDFFEGNIVASPHYPCHTLTLCGHEGMLYCHIELFNAFQWYVVLNFEYKGEDIFQTYTYDLLNDQEISREDYIASVKLPPGLPPIKKFRKLPPPHLAKMAHAASTNKEMLKAYNHHKFNQLSNFTKRHFVYNKAIALGIIAEDTQQ
ncbi:MULTISPECIES: HNH endonuclease [unclassified Pseudomonas]|uniref:HNH endonuclease n=1 Tax=unclassified Pseudomonas TaxID=196821 RepID=UPI001E3D3DD3|nr:MULTISPECIES: HNH endonuclease [unclassified Pseudomonas]MDH1692371.1 HNH endonuclease [Pseudomonas sp. GD03766]UFH29543.1 HNH endonuclease [Pseudomonas sp. CIP-10]